MASPLRRMIYSFRYDRLSRGNKVVKNSSVNLAYTIYDHGGKSATVAPAIIILHALFSNRISWDPVADSLSKITKRKVITLDTRNHGDSPHKDDMTQFAMVQDIKQVLHSLRLQLPITILGHSVGGRMGMTMALNDGVSWVKNLIVVDECPSMNPVLQKESTTPLYINLLKSINPNRYNSLQEIDDVLATKIKSKTGRRFLMQNVHQNNGRFSWKFNIESIANNLHNLREVPRPKGKQYFGSTIFIGGSNSNHIRPENYEEIEDLFPNATIRHVEGAGHWVHLQKTDEFLNIVSNFLSKDE